MKDIFDLFSDKDRKILGVMALCLLAALVFYVFIAGGQKSRHARTLHTTAALRLDLGKARTALEEKKSAWKAWERTDVDWNTLKSDFLYSAREVPTRIRLDLERLFQKTGVRAPALEYGYERFEKAGFSLIRIGFVVSGDYPRLRRFINALEAFPRLLVLEKVDFQDIDTDTGFLKLRISMGGYYHEE